MKKWLNYLIIIIGYLCAYLIISYLGDRIKPYLPEFHSPLPVMTELFFIATVAAIAIILYHFSKWAIISFRNSRD